ncbi:hypothetical protein K432DRAFT_306517 [Lepidopterella palustris CBS 459.81]|uniref:Uncharacterized protein n=1 Tax=Lepidopterella palustris CBS 459.81 TaxID=1314670 RepID=A0A8E2E2W0_9PEZI|nr:hypothetical protein K432DRAFT_306517 [Lepidopterella palustris CBS 459.81]
MGLRPKPQRAAFLHHLIRDQFTLSTWILLGAAIQGTLLLLPLRPTYVIGPSFALLALKLIDTICVTLGWRRNAYLDGTIGSKFSTLLPQPDGTFGSARQTANPDDGKVAVLLLGFRTNHPLGPLSPGARETGAYFTTMNKHLESNASTNGFLGSTAYLGTGRTTKSEIMTTFYFRSLADIETFAHGPVHREGWDWWNKTVKEHRHLGISHEVYEAPRGKWETVYMNYHKTGMGATVHHVEDGKGEGKWVEPLVDAVKGPLSTHKGRTSV